MRICGCLLVAILALANSADAEGQMFSYEPSLFRDTVYVFEPVWVLFVAHNLTGDTIPASPLELIEDYHSLSITDQESFSVLGTVIGGVYRYHPSGAIPPFGTKRSCAMLNYRSRIKDPVSREGYDVPWAYFPVGTYTAVFRWRYDPWGRARFNNSPYLWDTVVFHVVMPTGTDSLAMDSYMNGLREHRLRQTELLWEAYRQFPRSRYAAACLMQVATSMRVPDWSIRELSLRDVVRLLAVGWPDYPGIVAEIKSTAGWNEYGEGWAEKSKSLDRPFLQSIVDSVPPSSPAGMICDGLLNNRENEYLRLTPGLTLKKD